MKKNISKILAFAAFGFGSLFLFIPGFGFASGGEWGNVNWNQTYQAASGMGYLHGWLKGVQQNAWSNNNCCNNCNHHNNNDDRNHHSSFETYRSDDQHNNINVHQTQEVVGNFRSVSMEQSVRVYVNGQLTSSDQQLSVNHGHDAGQVQDVSVRGY